METIIFWVGIACIAISFLLVGLQYPIVFVIFSPLLKSSKNNGIFHQDNKKSNHDDEMIGTSWINNTNYSNHDYL